MEIETKSNRYNGLDGLRTYAAICVLIMHVKANIKYEIPIIIVERLINNMWRGVFLFMMISGFALCCGYYYKILNNKINIIDFYRKRYQKILPFFAILVILDVIHDFSREALLEGAMDLTLVYSLLPNPDISVIGVGWTLGVIFLFYLLFPFFCYLIRDKKSALITLSLMVAINYFCSTYFMTESFVVSGYKLENNILYCAIYFGIGGLTFLYKDQVVSFVRGKRVLVHCGTLIYTAIYFAIVIMRAVRVNDFFTTLLTACFFWLLLIIAISTEGKILNNRLTKFISEISLEIYLCHMVVFRVLERTGLLGVFQNRTVTYVIMCFLTLIGATVFSMISHKGIKKLYAVTNRN